MEYILNTDIFDKDIGSKFEKIIINDKELYEPDIAYRITVSFDESLLGDPRFDEFYTGTSVVKDTKKDKIRSVLNAQMDEIERVIEGNGIELCATRIQGISLCDDKIIKIEICEDNSKLHSKGRGKMPIVRSIVPSVSYIKKTTANYLASLMSKRI